MAPKMVPAITSMALDAVSQLCKQLDGLDPESAVKPEAVSAIKTAREVEAVLTPPKKRGTSR